MEPCPFLRAQVCSTAIIGASFISRGQDFPASDTRPCGCFQQPNSLATTSLPDSGIGVTLTGSMASALVKTPLRLRVPDPE